MKNYYTDKNYKELLKNMVILVDTREQKNENVIKWFEDNKVRYEVKALKTGDYNMKIEACPELGFLADTYFTDELCIEKKNSVSELAGNIANAEKDDNRLFKEFNRMIQIERNYMLIENNCVEDILEQKYRSNLNGTAFFRTLLTWQARNNMHIYFVRPETTGRMIYELCKNCLDANILK